jgi:predicted permease
VIRFFRALLRLYPAGFRAEYGDEMCRTFAERASRSRGPAAALATAIAALADVVPNAIGVQLEILRQDAGYAARSLRRTPGFATTAVLVVALGVGANTAVFSIADFMLVRPLPFANPDRLVKIWEGSPAMGRNEVSPADYRDWRALTTSFSDMAALTLRSSNLVSTSEPRELQTAMATPDLFRVLGVAPALGRAFTPAEVEAEPAVILSDGLWRSHFGADPAVLGTVVKLNGVPHTVLGVMPPAFRFPLTGVEAWTPLGFHEEDYQDRGNHYLQVVARLRPGVSRARAREDLALASARLERQYPENKDVRALMMGFRDELTQRSRLLVVALCGAALCVLLLACANLASLFLARGLYRSHELAVRSALGAGRDRLVRQLVTESVGVSILGGIVGVLAAVAGLPLLSRLVPDSLPVAGHPALDLRVLAFASALVLLTGLAFGLLPALRASRASPLAALGPGSRATRGPTQRLRGALVVVEVASSVVLLVTSGLMIRAVWRLQAVNPGFDADHVVALRTALPANTYGVTLRRVEFYGRVLERVRALPGVRSAAYATGLPMSMRGGIWSATVDGQPVATRGEDNVSLRFVTPGFFSTLDIPLRRGRDLSDRDTRERPNVAVVSTAFVKRHWPGADPLGRQFKLGDTVRTVVGVVGDVRVRGLETSSEPQVYLPPAQVADSAIVGYFPKELVVRASPPIDPASLTPAIRRIVHAVDPEQPVSNVRRLSDLLEGETAPRVTQLRLLGGFAAIALLIAGLGIHGLLTFTVSLRRREIGIRRALGAEFDRILGLVLSEGLALAGIGIAVGIAVGYGAARGMGALLMGVRPEDPLTLLAAASLCFVTAVAGGLRPALQALRVDPMVALREE